MKSPKSESNHSFSVQSPSMASYLPWPRLKHPNLCLHFCNFITGSSMSWALMISLDSWLLLSLHAPFLQACWPSRCSLDTPRPQWSQNLCHCLEHFLYESPALSFSSSGLCSSATFSERPVLSAPYKMLSPYFLFSSEHFSSSHLTWLFIISFHHENASSEDQDHYGENVIHSQEIQSWGGTHGVSTWRLTQGG